MRVTHHETPGALLGRAGAFLEASEAENGLILGICAAPGPPPEGASWLSVDDGDRTIAVAIRTPPFNLLLSRAAVAALEVLAAALGASETSLPGVSGPVDTAQTFADLWTKERDLETVTEMRQGIYGLTRVVVPSPQAPGALREAAAADVPHVAEWMGGFSDDAALPAEERDAFQRRAAGLVAQGAVFLWVDGDEPVSMAALMGPTPHGIRVSMVYTPRALRGRGYASACVAALSARALDAGRAFCMLYTDLANPTSNDIYRRVGYEMLVESVVLRFRTRS